MKKHICILFFILFTLSFSSAFEMPYFNGYTGLLGSINNSELTGQILFDGQIDFKGKLLLRGGIYIQTNDLTNRQIFSNATEPNSFFTLEEVSATYKFSIINTTNYLAAFIGNYEPIGSDIFLRRQFGLQPISSIFTTSWHGLNGATIYKMDGFGGAYTIKINQILAAGSYIYGTKVNDYNYFNTDFRFAGVFDRVIFDSILGFGFPIENKNNDDNVILLVRTLTLHGGASVLIGNTYDKSLFMQAGVRTLIFDPNAGSALGSSNDISNYYLFIEPRFVMQYAQLNVSIFGFPHKNMEDMLYLSLIPSKYQDSVFSVGNNITIVSNQIHFSNIDLNGGLHFSSVITDADLKLLASEPLSLFKWKFDILLTPFVNLDILGGTLESSTILSFMDLPKGLSSAIKINIGYKAQL